MGSMKVWCFLLWWKSNPKKTIGGFLVLATDYQKKLL